jgi:hypothetical protein
MNDTDQQSPGQSQFDGMTADTKINVVGTNFSTDEHFELGQAVKLEVSGHVVMSGFEVLESEGKRHVVKVQADVIEVV